MPGDPETLALVFMRYASRQDGNNWVVRPQGLRRMLRDMRMLDGVAPEFVDAYIRQLYLRADMDRDGALSFDEFVLWYVSEAAALLPFGKWSCLYRGNHGLTPLYNRYVRICTCLELARAGGGCGAGSGGGAAGSPERWRPKWLALGGGAGDGGSGGGGRSWEADSVRRQAPGLTVMQLVDMMAAARVTSGSRREEGEVAGAAKVALQGCRAERVRAERVHGQLEGANHLNWLNFMRALVLSASKGAGLASVILRVMAEGSPPPARLPPPPPPGEDNELLDSLFMSSDVEGGAFDMRQEWPPGSGTSHPLWILDSPARLRDQAEAARAILRGPLRQLTAGSSGAASSPSYTPVPQLSRLCGRNLRAAFQRYCAKWNKGPLPPHNPTPAPKAQDGGDSASKAPGAGTGAGKPAAAAPSPEPLEDPWAWYWGACCCCFRSLTLMEMSAWLRVVGDCATVRAALMAPGSGLTPRRLEHVFTLSASVAGVYLGDDTSGVHDLTVTSGPSSPLQQLPRGRATPGLGPGSRYGHVTKSMEGLRHSLRGSLRGSLQQQAAWTPLRDRETDAGGGPATSSPPASPSGRTGGHRAPVLALSYVQFLEALRLLAEEMVGHPVTNAKVDAVLLAMLSDITAEPFPRQDATSCVGLGPGPPSRTSRPPSAPPW
ncbi:hypothetical protein CHLRE_01g018700v5 [Chlamydomonas reinhardtii]|uniref:EF-hand domain-containing protein n=1 Tax=Chlamydomonas reinhardtii TaxID=3055 RepID=A0A2K3E5X2_CHLRE|nr:uncharacterized protein CHLRE_01g018700v5 [Chlamydomonas reinhardtii]PNW88198.1 hypothetical protein CHLRE_01g018700v5 [Chlamydomonas reinhardtii]